ncbi:hypothetical protein ABH14_04400 [Brevibacillus brevis]|nr:hypothetical protein [Brevibacillus brevis]
MITFVVKISYFQNYILSFFHLRLIILLVHELHILTFLKCILQVKPEIAFLFIRDEPKEA